MKWLLTLHPHEVRPAQGKAPFPHPMQVLLVPQSQQQQSYQLVGLRRTCIWC